MPELPEVEITVRKLRPLLLGKRILNLRNRKIIGVRRLGKVILIHLSGDRILAFHQRMTGKLLVVKRGLGDKHVRRRFKLSSGKDLIFHDIRKFGVIWLGARDKIFQDKYLSKLGKDPLGISLAEFMKLLNVKRGMIKPLLLRQDVFSGIGNIIADEALWRAKIHPRKNIQQLSEREKKNLYKSLRHIIVKSIRLGGTTMRDWLRPDGSEGGYYKNRLVYRRKDERCKRCGAAIKRIVVGSRGTFICEHCQRL